MVSLLQIMTHWPGWYCPRQGQDRRVAALRRTSLLLVVWKARRAHSRIWSMRRNSDGCIDPSSRRMASCDGMDSSLSTDPGTLACFPNTITSGAYPCLMLREFLA